MDDDRRLRALLFLVSGQERLSRDGGGLAAEARAYLESLEFELIVLDVMMPGESGLSLAASLRETSDIPILMLTARSDAVDRVRGLEAGVDDYLGKPYEPKELLLRIASILRRARAAPARPDGSALRFGPFVFFMERGELRHGEEIVRLTEREREILRLLGASPGASVSREALVRAGRQCPGAHDRRADQPAAPQDRTRSDQSALSPDRARVRLQTGRRSLSAAVESGVRGAFSGAVSLWRGGARSLANVLPKGLYARSLLIVILPMVLLQGAVAYVFMQRHWDLVTHRLSSAVARDVGAITDLYREAPRGADDSRLRAIASERFRMSVELLPPQPLPPRLPHTFFDVLDPLIRALPSELSAQLREPFWVDAVGRSGLMEIRVDLGFGVLRFITRRALAYDANVHIFILWMVGASIVLIAVAILFLRNQIRPILRLAEAAEDFGKGRDLDFQPRGAREVRQAGYAFIEMKRRIERATEQRTPMLNGVSHDLRTILTRFKLSLEMMDESPEREPLQRDVVEMQGMLEGYLAFARGDGGEPTSLTNLRTTLEELREESERHGAPGYAWRRRAI